MYDKHMRTCMLSHFSWVQFFATPWTVACQAPLSIGFPRKEYWSGLPCPSPGDLPNPGTELLSLMSPALAGRFFTTSDTWEAHDKHISVHKWIHCCYYLEQIAVRSIKKNERFCSIFTYSFFDALLSLNRYEFLTYIIFLISEELLLTFIARQVYWQKNSLNLVSLLLLLSQSVMSDSLQLHALQHTRLLCPSPSPKACSHSCQLSWWYYPIISSP